MFSKKKKKQKLFFFPIHPGSFMRCHRQPWLQYHQQDLSTTSSLTTMSSYRRMTSLFFLQIVKLDNSQPHLRFVSLCCLTLSKPSLVMTTIYAIVVVGNNDCGITFILFFDLNTHEIPLVGQGPKTLIWHMILLLILLLLFSIGVWRMIKDRQMVLEVRNNESWIWLQASLIMEVKQVILAIEIRKRIGICAWNNVWNQ